ncbi:MAG: arginine repressor [Lachnospiraceae bacterium]|nr:arginine repressor [Lachnospiraceae bacterium]
MQNSRTEKILELIDEYEIQTQEELASLLKQSGFQVTQATVSRDINKLHIIKVPAENGGQKYARQKKEAAGDEGRYTDVLRAGFASMDTAGELLVIRTEAGMAMAIAAALDAMQLPQIVGCIAGDDTIMCAIKTPEALKEVREILQEIVRN